MEYRNHLDRSQPRGIPAALALLGSFMFFLAPVGSAQTHSSTSSSSGHASTSASSHTTTFQSSPSPARNTSSSNTRHNDQNHRSRRYWRGGVYYPYVETGSDAYNTSGNSEAECQGGPTIFDRCSSAPGSYIPPMNEGPAHPQLAQAYARPADSSADSANPTTLVFKDGHELEVDNYAIAGQTLYDLTPGRSQKIALSDLDLSATQKQNQSQGAMFELPPSPHSNLGAK
jgi:hypothetical protein